MSPDIDVISKMAQASGMPQEIWQVKPSESVPQLRGYDYTAHAPTESNLGRDSWDGIAISSEIVNTLNALSALHTLGLGTLVRLPNKITVMTSIAEIAFVSLNSGYHQLLWALMQMIEMTLRNGERYSSSGSCKISWKQEQTPEEHFRKESRRRLVSMSSEFTSSRASDFGMNALIEEQAQINARLSRIEKQNQEILRLLREGTKPPATSAITKDPLVEAKPEYYEDYTGWVFFSKSGKQWLLHASPGSKLREAFEFLLDWLTVNLGGVPVSSYYSLLPSIDVMAETKAFHEAEELEGNRDNGCWRTKFRSGRIFDTRLLNPLPSYSETAFRQFPADGMYLTAAALWTLFDNSLERISGCLCTFRATGGGFLQCRSIFGKWLVWHCFTEGTVCDGTRCHENVRIALAENQPGERISTHSPCILGWFASSRHHADCNIWEILRVSSSFRSKVSTTYAFKEVQVLAQLSAPLMPSPQIGGALTYAKRNYIVTNSIDKESEFALLRAASKVVLIYDERRQLHLTLDGADIIEMCCVFRLRQVGCDLSPLQSFSHPTALGRLTEWSSTNFNSIMGTAFPGAAILRQVISHVNELIEQTDEASSNDKRIYWLLEDLLRGTPSTAVKAPKSREFSWHRLAGEANPLIFAVGTITTCYLSLSGEITPSSPQSLSGHLTSKFMTIVSNGIGYKGIIVTKETVGRWINQAQGSTKLSLSPTNHLLKVGPGQEHVATIYMIQSDSTKGTYKFDCDCVCEAEKLCLHYVQ